MKWLWLMTVLTLAALLELAAAAQRLLIPVLALSGVYLAVVYGGKRVIVLLLFAAVLLDAVLMRHGPATSLAVLPALSIAAFWRRHGNCRHLPAQVVPGLVAAVAYTLTLMAWKALTASPLVLAELMMDSIFLVEAAVGGALLMPVLCALLDMCAFRLQLPLYAEVRHTGKEL